MSALLLAEVGSIQKTINTYLRGDDGFRIYNYVMTFPTSTELDDFLTTNGYDIAALIEDAELFSEVQRHVQVLRVFFYNPSAMKAIASSTNAVRSIISDQALLDEVVASATAMNAFAASQEAMDAILDAIGSVTKQGDTFKAVTDLSGSTHFMDIFTTTTQHSWSAPSWCSSVDVLVVAGGGGGGSGGGGGAGGLVLKEKIPVAELASVVEVSVGAGGIGVVGNSDTSSSGENSSFGGFTALGGGAGGGWTTPGHDGGSGGGGSGRGGALGGKTLDSNPPNSDYQGHDGGRSYLASGSPAGAGGGGGAGAIGADAPTNSRGGDGGAGLDLSHLFGTEFGDNGWFAGGGAGHGTAISGTGGLGGGGGSEIGTSAPNGENGMAGTGGGGGGGGWSSSGKRGDGGSGIVILRYHA